MKFFAFIMAGIILIMSCIPCKDAPASMKAEKQHETLAVADNHTHEDAGDDCTPLCSCACCSAHPCPQANISVATSAPDISLKHATFYTGSLTSVSLPVWQPPQLKA